MPFSPIDALMPKAAPKRAADGAPRTESGGAFQPALENAYKDKAEAPTKPAAPAAERKPAEKSPTTGEKRDSKQPADQAAARSQAVSEAPETDEVVVEESIDGEDAAEISAEAAAAVQAIEHTPLAQTVPPPTAVEGEQVEQVAAVAAPQAPTTEETGEGAGNEADAGEPLAEGEIEFSNLHATQTNEMPDSTAKPTVPTADGEPVVEASAEQPEAPVAETTAPAAGAETSGEEKIVAPENAETPTDERSEDDASDDGGESKDKSAVAELKVEAIAEESAAAANTALNAANDSEASANDTASAPAPTSEAAATAADAASRTTKALDRLMGSRSLKSANEPNDLNGMPTVDRARFVQRVEGAMRAAHQRDGKIQVRLSPPELGSVKIELAMQNGVLQAKLEAETPAARNILLDSLPALRERLAQQDIRIEKFDVDVRQEGGNAGSNQTDDRTADQSGERQQNRSRSAGGNRAAATPIVARAVATGSSAAAGLDVRV